MKPQIFLLLGIVSVIFISGCTQTGQIIGQCRDVQEAYEDCNDVQICENVPYTEYGCEYVELDYSSSDDDMRRSVTCIKTHKECIEWFSVPPICLEWETVCDTYKETASFDLKNRDTERATWFFNWMRECKPDEPLCDIDEPVVHSSEMITLDPKVTRTLSSDITYDADGEENLYVTFIHIPEKEVCETITKYRDECRTEERCETKYRTVEVCD